MRELKGQRLSSSTLPVTFNSSEAYDAHHAVATSPHGSVATTDSVRIPDFKLSPLLCRQCIELFFNTYETWFPIIHKPSFLLELEDPSAFTDSPAAIVVKAMIAVILPHTDLPPDMSPQQKHDISARLRSEVVNSAMRELCLRSLQSLMILVVRDYGDGRIAEAWNLMGVRFKQGLYKNVG